MPDCPSGDAGPGPAVCLRSPVSGGTRLPWPGLPHEGELGGAEHPVAQRRRAGGPCRNGDRDEGPDGPAIAKRRESHDGGDRVTFPIAPDAVDAGGKDPHRSGPAGTERTRHDPGGADFRIAPRGEIGELRQVCPAADQESALPAFGGTGKRARDGMVIQCHCGILR